MAFYEWSGHYVTTENYGEFNVNDYVYFPYVEKDKLKTKRVKIVEIKYDKAAPKREWQNPEMLCIEKKFLRKKTYKIPMYLLSKTEGQARDTYIKQRKYLKNIKEI